MADKLALYSSFFTYPRRKVHFRNRGFLPIAPKRLRIKLLFGIVVEGEHFKPGATRVSQFGSPVQFAFPGTNERRSPGVDH